MSLLSIACTIYVHARIMEVDGSVGKTPINLIMLSIFFFFFCSGFLSNPLSLCSLAFICSSLFPDFLCKGIQQQAFVSCILYSAKLAELVSTKSTAAHKHAATLRPSDANLHSVHTDLDLFLFKWKWAHS